MTDKTSRIGEIGEKISESAMADIPIGFEVLIDVTPSTSDPPNADQFYHALGMAMVAWGRLEGHFLSGLLLIISIDGHDFSDCRLPMKWEQQERAWAHAFDRIELLRSLKGISDEFLKEMDDLAKDRNAFVHALWGRFLDGPVRMDFRSLRSLTGTRVGLRLGEVSTDYLIKFVKRASELNMKLLPMTQVLAELRGFAPPGTPVL
jgi:hypothetical protein